MTQTVAEECWSRVKASKRVSGDLSLTLMDKTQKLSRAYSGGFVPDSRHTVEAVGESEGFCSPVHVGSENSCTPKRRCISLNENRCDGLYVGVEVITLGKLSSLEKTNLVTRFRRELELVQKFQKKILPSHAVKSNGILVSSSTDQLAKKQVLSGQNISQLKHGITGRFDSKKHGSAPSSGSALMKQCETLLKRLMRHQYAWVFNSPVDVVKLNIPDYLTVIKHPMDLGTIQSNIASGVYSNPLDFASDVRLTFSNAMTYNPPQNDVHVMANTMRKFFEMGWKTIEKKLHADATVKTAATKPASQSKKRKFPLEQCNSVVLEYKTKQKMTDEEKLSLSQQLSLIEELPQHLIDFLKRHTDKANQNCEDELEIDFDSLSDDTLFELRKLLDEFSKGSHFEKQKKNVPCELETLNESGLSNSSMPAYKENELKEEDEDEDVDIGGNDPPTSSYFPAERLNIGVPKSSRGGSSYNSSSESGSSSSDSDSSGISRSQSNLKVASAPNSTKYNGSQAAPSHEKELASRVEQNEHCSSLNAESLQSIGSQKGENVTSERRVSPDKLYRAALLRSRFADTILKAREKTLDQGEKKDPERLRREREELERQQREERARLQAEAKAAEDARRRAKEEAAAEAKRKRDLEREAARQALLRMERTVVINEGNVLLKDLEMLGTVPGEHIPSFSIDKNDFNLGGSNPLERLGLYMKAEDDEEEDGDEPNIVPANEIEEGEVD